MNIRYEIEKKCNYEELISGEIFLLDGSCWIKTDHDTAVNLGSGREVGLDVYCRVGVPSNVELVIMS